MGLFEELLKNALKQVEELDKETKEKNKALINCLKQITKKENIDIEIDAYSIQENCDDTLYELQKKGKLTDEVVIRLIRNGYRIREEAPDEIKNNLKFILLSIEEKDYQILDYIDDKIIEQIPENILNEVLNNYEISSRNRISRALSKNLIYVKKMIEQEEYTGNYKVLDYTNDELANQIPKEYVIMAINKGYNITEQTPKSILENREIVNHVINETIKKEDYNELAEILRYSPVITKEDIELIYKSKKIDETDKNWILFSACSNKYIYNNVQFIKQFIEYGYGNIVEYSSTECLKELSQEKRDYIEEAIKTGITIDKNTSDFIKNNNKFMLTYILKRETSKESYIIDDGLYDELEDIISKEKLSEILNDKELLKKQSLKDILLLLSFSKNDNKTILEVISEKINIDKERLKSKLKYLHDKNEYIYQQIDLKILDNEFDFIDIEVINRIIPDTKIMQKLIQYKNEPRWKNTKKILKICLDYIQNIYGQNTNYDEIIYKIITQGISTDNFNILFENIETIDKQQTKLLIKLLLNKENVYNITTSDELKKENFEKIINDYFKHTEERIKESNNIDYVKYQVLYKIYNITKEEVDLIIKRYHFNSEEKQNSILKSINYIMKCENINELKELYSKIKSPEFNYDKFWMYESDIRNEYIKQFNKTLYIPKQEDFVETIEYENKKVKIYEVNSDFNMIIHVYNAILEETEEARTIDKTGSTYYDWNAAAMLNHGICCSYIGQNFIALANGYKNPKFGFINLEHDSIIHMGPDDIGTGNENFGETYANIEEDIFYTPEDLIINTVSKKNSFYNEVVLERKKLKNTAQQYKRNPDYILYTYEDDSESRVPINIISEAAVFEIPIVKVNIQKIIEREIKKIDNDFLELQQTRNANLIKKIIINIYCNMKNSITDEYYEKLHEKLDQIIYLIETEKQKDETFALNLYKKVLEVQKKYLLLDKSIIDSLNQIMLNNKNTDLHIKK